VDLRTSIIAFVDGQFLPLTPEIQQLQDVVEDRVQRQFDRWSSAPHRQVRQDKLLELLKRQTRRYPLPLLGSLHFVRPNGRILADSALDRETQHWRALQTNSLAQETRNQLQASLT